MKSVNKAHRTALRDRRHGVVLLVVLSLLALFVVICTTFILVASHYSRAARSQTRAELYREPPQELLDSAMYQLVRGTRDGSSDAFNNDLLSDLYGYDGFIAYGEITAINGTHIALEVFSPSVPFNVPDQVDWPAVQASPPQGWYDQTWDDITLWRSIHDRSQPYLYRPLTQSGTYRQMPAHFGFLNGHFLTFLQIREVPDINNPQNSFAIQPPDTTCAITNYFYDETGGGGDTAFITATWPLRATDGMPQLSNSGSTYKVQILVNGRPFNGDGSLAFPDESYDMADQNKPSPKNLFLADPINHQLCSLHSGLASIADVQVDNDGDGVPDGVWLDLGFPTKTSADGRLYKPRFSFLCLDMDGRLNLNFHGNLQHVSIPSANSHVSFSEDTTVRTDTLKFENSPMADLTRGPTGYGTGSGYGVADVSLYDFLARTLETYVPKSDPQFANLAALWYQQLLVGRSSPAIPGRYSWSNTPGIAGQDLLTNNKFSFFLPAMSRYDLHGGLGFGFDHRGMPLFQRPYYSHLINDNPYELNIDAPRGTFGGNAVPDELFSLEDLETLLRLPDWDVGNAPSRIRRLSELTFNSQTIRPYLSQRMRQSVTTESWDLPVINFQYMRPKEDAMSMEPNSFASSVTDLIFRRLPKVGVDRQKATNALISKNLIAPEVLSGVRMDLNRTLATQADKQQFAQQLYFLVLLIVDPPSANVQQWREMIAQWAINVVDFRDEDAVMTAFYYDIDPFSNGWNDDPNQPNFSDMKVVFGCERPELLLTEAISLHDMRVEYNSTSMKWEQGYRPRGSVFIELYNPWASPDHQSHLNMWPAEPPLGQDFNLTNAGVYLNQIVPSSGDPVWRLRIESQEGANALPERQVYFTVPPASLRIPGQTYYTDLPMAPIGPGNYGVVGSCGWLSDPSVAGNAMDIDVDGPSGTPDGIDDFTTTIGWHATLDSPGNVRYDIAKKIEFTRIGNNTGVPYLAEVDLNSPRGSFPKNAVGAVINRCVPTAGVTSTWRSLNVSEPNDGYASKMASIAIIDHMENQFNQKVEPHFDSWDPNAPPTIASVAILERLADPTKPFLDSPGNVNHNPYIIVDKSKEFETAIYSGLPGSGTVQPANFVSEERQKPLWGSNWGDSGATKAGNTSYVIQEGLDNTLGYLMDSYGAPSLSTSANPPFPDDFYRGGPTTPETFPSLTWLNRPYINQYELLQVPVTSSEFLSDRYKTPDILTSSSAADWYVLPLVKSDEQYAAILEFTHCWPLFLGQEGYTNTERIYQMRTPGRININTIADPSIWNALWNGREIPVNAGPGTQSWIPDFVTDANDLVGKRPFRAIRIEGQQSENDFLEIFANPSGPSKGYPRSAYSHLNGDLHLYARYRGLMRLGNLVTTHSNVYAVWITLAYFEVDPTNPASFGQELGAETGQIERHRSFYIIDRSIPVAFEPDENHNVDKAVLLRRFIE